uniref:hypothetical protein n=1 Tax=Okeania sp. SIO2F4 TaxID=2607790 RepID=UPI0025DB5025
ETSPSHPNGLLRLPTALLVDWRQARGPRHPSTAFFPYPRGGAYPQFLGNYQKFYLVVLVTE